MARGKNAPKKDSFMDELKDVPDDERTEGNNDDDVDNDEQRGEGEEVEQPDLMEQPARSKRGLSSVPMTLKRVRKIVGEISLDGLSIADKFDLKMTSSYIDFLKATIDNMLESIK